MTLSGLFYLYCYPDSEGSLHFSAFARNTAKNWHGIPCFRLFGLPIKLLSSIFTKHYYYGFFIETKMCILSSNDITLLFQFRRTGTDPAISQPKVKRFSIETYAGTHFRRKKSLARDRNYHGIVRTEICTQHKARDRNFSP